MDKLNEICGHIRWDLPGLLPWPPGWTLWAPDAQINRWHATPKIFSPFRRQQPVWASGGWRNDEVEDRNQLARACYRHQLRGEVADLMRAELPTVYKYEEGEPSAYCDGFRRGLELMLKERVNNSGGLFEEWAIEHTMRQAAELVRLDFRPSCYW